ncbi:nucleoside hydrolase [Chroococcus sp. FPU101]|uniref:nucleoside hydrolase n=1 Tax=Chroococcus sp. FPU101 TaxID=1974212 RepID=UPI001A8CDA91|nr:nucleoside hydrolase [Chroococcus sp. FPU101]GFE71123.1 Inosine-uridine preferring nucleoside hydrolase superfamily [Chroococcus sp. FPU101]
MTPSKVKIILDTDPGGDDAFALLWLLSLVKQRYAELVAVTTVDGNVHAKYTFTGASKLLELAGFDHIEVAKGIIGGSAHGIEDAGLLHGIDGMGNLTHTLPECTNSYFTARFADEVLIEKLNASPGEITIIAIAPLTNLAAAEKKSPGILKKAKDIIIMGGAFLTSGNLTPEGEFNIAYDVEAANIVFSCREDLVVLPLDITRKLIFTNYIAQNIKKVNPESAIAQLIVSLAEFMCQTSQSFRETSGLEGFLVHDAVTLAYLFYPETLLFRRAKVRIETKGEWTTGKTVFDHRHKTKIGANAWVAMEVDAVNVLAAMSEDLKILIR